VIPRSREAIDEAARLGESVPETKLESPMCLESMVSTHMDAAMISPEQRDRVLGLFRTEFSSKTSEFPSVARWRIRHLSWSNALCYGQDNWIDFDSLENMNSVLGPNGIGKSNIIDILILVLYNEVIRGTKKSALNTAACNGHIKCVISIAADMYSIERAWLDANNVVVRLYKNGTNASGADMLKTYEEIQRLIGPLRVFLNTALALQQRQFLVDISSKERYELVCRMVDLDRLRAVEDDNKSELRVAKKLLAAIPAGQIHSLTARRSEIETTLADTRISMDGHITRLNALRARQHSIEHG
jgi:DNA repair exonuclease SbcCD ATPase subunit